MGTDCLFGDIFTLNEQNIIAILLKFTGYFYCVNTSYLATDAFALPVSPNVRKKHPELGSGQTGSFLFIRQGAV